MLNSPVPLRHPAECSRVQDQNSLLRSSRSSRQRCLLRLSTIAIMVLTVWLSCPDQLRAQPVARPAATPVAGSNTRPNVVMIISDDQAWTDYGFMEHPVIQTPHLDQLAARSVVFPRGYVPTALCRPSLMTMITGLYPHQHGVTGNDPAPNRNLTDQQYDALKAELISNVDRHPTLPRILGQQGFVSHQSGKWWEGSYQRGGFTAGMTRGFPEPGGRHGDDGLQIGRRGLQPVFDFVDQAVEEEQPFFLWYAPFLPHTPHNPPERLLQKYTSDQRPPELAKYFAMCEWFDETCGELLNHLDDKRLTDNTIVIYVCDNGWIQATSENVPQDNWKQAFAPRSKQSPYDGGTRTPIMYSWPGRFQPGVLSERVSSIDIVPTVLAALDIEAPDDLPGVDLNPLLTRTGQIHREFLYGESFSHDVADVQRPEVSLMYRWIIHSGKKLLLSYEAAPDRYAAAHAGYERTPQLFDLDADPFEKSNLAAKYPDEVSRLAGMLQAVWDVEKPPVGL